MENREIAEKIIEAVNQTTNDYDAIEQVQQILNSYIQWKLQKEKQLI